MQPRPGEAGRAAEGGGLAQTASGLSEIEPADRLLKSEEGLTPKSRQARHTTPREVRPARAALCRSFLVACGRWVWRARARQARRRQPPVALRLCARRGRRCTRCCPAGCRGGSLGAGARPRRPGRRMQAPAAAGTPCMLPLLRVCVAAQRGAVPAGGDRLRHLVVPHLL